MLWNKDIGLILQSKGSASMTIAICDDEKNIRELIGNKILYIYPEAELFFFRSGEELLVSKQDIDICFLDIQMQGINGMETARELRKKDHKLILIFVTVLEEYVFQAFDVGALHYLIKPVDDKKLEDVLKKAVEQAEAGQKKIEQWESGRPEEKYVMVSHNGMHQKVLIDTIIYAEVFNRKVIIHRQGMNGKDCDVEYYGRLSDLEKAAGEDFFRPHRAYLVNLKYVEKYDASTIWLEKGVALMAKQKFPEFVKKYMKYNQRRGNQNGTY